MECHSRTPVVGSETTRDCNDTESSALIMLFRRYQDNNNISVIFPHNSPEWLDSSYTAQIKIEKCFGDLHNITTAIPVDLTSLKHIIIQWSVTKRLSLASQRRLEITSGECTHHSLSYCCC